jgi:nitroreductase
MSVAATATIRAATRMPHVSTRTSLRGGATGLGANGPIGYAGRPRLRARERPAPDDPRPLAAPAMFALLLPARAHPTARRPRISRRMESGGPGIGSSAEMETWDAIRARRNVRSFTDEALTDVELDRILEAGRRSPSANNSQPWDLVVISGRAELEALAHVWQGARHVARSAATIVIVAPIVEDEARARFIEYDLGQLTLQMAIAAADLGIGTGHAAVDDQELLRRLLGVPEGYRGAALLARGHPADRPLAPLEHPNRRPFDDVVHRGGW